MSDDELLERIWLGIGYLRAHGRENQCKDIMLLCERYAAARAEADRLGTAIREAMESWSIGENRDWILADLKDILGEEGA